MTKSKAEQLDRIEQRLVFCSRQALLIQDWLIELLLSDEVSIPSSQQALACLRVCQMLSNGYRAIYLFRYDTTRQVVYIQAGTEAKNDEIEIEIPNNGFWRFIP